MTPSWLTGLYTSPAPSAPMPLPGPPASVAVLSPEQKLPSLLPPPRGASLGGENRTPSVF